MHDKSEIMEEVSLLILRPHKERGVPLKVIRNDRAIEFKNKDMKEFCLSQGIGHQDSAAITLKQNCVAEQKNKSMLEMTRVMIHAKQLSINFG